MPAGKVTTYTNTLAQKRGVTDLISTIDPMDVPLLNALGYGSANIKKFRLVNFPSTMYEWLEDTYSAGNASAAASVTQLTNDTTYTALVVTSGEGVKFQVGDVLALDSELVWVSSISTDTLTITRGFGGTTQATHASTVTVTLRTRARVEGADANDSPTTNPTSGYNYTQILQKTINVTRTRQKVSQYGIEDEYDYQTQKAMEELAVLGNNIAYYGKRAAGSASAARGAGGGKISKRCFEGVQPCDNRCNSHRVLLWVSSRQAKHGNFHVSIFNSNTDCASAGLPTFCIGKTYTKHSKVASRQ